MRHLRLVKDDASFDFFKHWKLWLGISAFMIVLAMVSFGVRGLTPSSTDGILRWRRTAW